jgi:hypothetical protein
VTRADQHWWRTTDGRLVPTGHPDSAFLAYAPGDEMPDPAPEPAAPAELDGEERLEAPKSRRPAANKSRRPVGDK